MPTIILYQGSTYMSNIFLTNIPTMPDNLVISKYRARVANNFLYFRNVRDPVGFGLVAHQWNTHTCARFVGRSMFYRRPRPYYNAIRLVILLPLRLRPNRAIG